jgi:predicted amidohydrolase
MTSCESLLGKAEKWLEACYESGTSVVVFPAMLGCLFNDWESYISEIIRMSCIYKGMAICPGSCYEKDSGETFHTSWVIMEGNIIIKQRQIYLAKWEKELGLSRGNELKSYSLDGMKLGIIVSTDVFYPQVSRALAMSGVELVLVPSSIKGSENTARQLSGLWQNVQANLFFGIESGFKGSFKGHEFYSTSMIHAPLEMTEKGDGILIREDDRVKKSIITADIDNEKRKAAVKRFNTLAQLNYEVYRNIFKASFGGA